MNKAYLLKQTYANPDVVPNYTDAQNSFEVVAAKADFDVCKKCYIEVKNMNQALTGTFIELVPSTYKQEFENKCTSNPNVHFCEYFELFLNVYR